jgi:hypothetical protein
MNNGKLASESYNPINYLHNVYTRPFTKIKLKHTTTGEIEEIIRNLKVKNSYGYDEISTKIIKASAPYIRSPLSHIVNRILSTGIFPHRLKFSEIKPVYKKGDRTNFANYKPISLLPSFSKIFEKLTHKRLDKHIRNNNILAKEQYGFVVNSSTEIATHNLLNTMLSSLNNKLYVGVLFCDLQKAFDGVNHELLISKMNFYGITGIANKLIKSYLSNRYQRLVTNDNKLNKISSKWEEAKCGVAQCSILGPLIFLLYINDFPKTISEISSRILFADDTSIIIANPNPTEFTKNTNQLLSYISRWFISNMLYLNYDKTYFMQFVTKKNKEIDMRVNFANKCISNISNTKFLGLTIDASMSWKVHIKELTTKINKACYAIILIKPIVSLNVLITIYFAVFTLLYHTISYFGATQVTVQIFSLSKKE